MTTIEGIMNQMQNWLNEKTVIYQIFIDRFAGYDPDCDPLQPEWCGGNLQGITDKLDYLSDLGVNAIYLTPFFKSSAYHGYATEDFYAVDPHFGTKEDVKKFTSAAHKRNMRVIIDFTANHVSENHPFFQDAITNPDSKYRKWFHFKKWPKKYKSFLDFKNLPKLNLDHEPARRHVIEAAKYWVNEFGIDGLRLDHVIGQPERFWEEFYEEIKRSQPNTALIAEVAFFGVKLRDMSTLLYRRSFEVYLRSKFSYKNAYHKLYYELNPYFDAFLDFHFRHLVAEYARSNLSFKRLKKKVHQHFETAPSTDVTYITFLDNQDKNRFLYILNNDIGKLKKIAQLQFSLAYPTILYYGTEIGMTQNQEAIPNTQRAADTPARGLMQWDGLDEKQKNLLEFYKKLT